MTEVNIPAPIDLSTLSSYVVSSMESELRAVSRSLYRTPKWRKVKRYNLFEKKHKLEISISLLM